MNTDRETPASSGLRNITAYGYVFLGLTASILIPIFLCIYVKSTHFIDESCTFEKQTGNVLAILSALTMIMIFFISFRVFSRKNGAMAGGFTALALGIPQYAIISLVYTHAIPFPAAYFLNKYYGHAFTRIYPVQDVVQRQAQHNSCDHLAIFYEKTLNETFGYCLDYSTEDGAKKGDNFELTGVESEYGMSVDKYEKARGQY